MPFTEPNARASKQPYARGGCCGRGRYSAWVTTGYPRGSWRESSRTRGNVDRGGRRKSGRTAWQIIFGYLASRGTGKPPHSTLGHGTTPYKKGAVGLWPRGWGKKSVQSTAEEERSGRGGQGWGCTWCDCSKLKTFSNYMWWPYIHTYIHPKNSSKYTTKLLKRGLNFR